MSTVVITGANRGIGLELVKIYAGRGDTVLACCRNPGAATDLAEVAGTVEILETEVSDAKSVAALAESLQSRAVDILINNAGIMGPAPAKQSVQEMDFEGWAETFAVNSMAPVRIMQALMANLRASSDAKLVTITSQMGALSLDMPMAYAYCASKAALNKFMKMAALELGKEGINVCVIHPGWVQTDMGGAAADITPQQSAEGIVKTIDGLNADNNGSFWKWDGETHDW
jgi:NAD(P)-dependent dehydrogenase (short-subunit alcohol dehydrogenase family)